MTSLSPAPPPPTQEKTHWKTVTYICDHFSPRLITFSVTSFFLQHLDDSFSGGPVFQSELRNHLAQLVRFGRLDPVQRNTQPQTKFVKSVHNSSVYLGQGDYPFGAVSQKIRNPIFVTLNQGRGQKNEKEEVAAARKQLERSKSRSRK